MGKEIIFHIMYYLNFLCIIYSSFKLLSYLYHYLYFYMLYISNIINIFHTLYIICINYIFLYKSCLCNAYHSYYTIIFHCKFPQDFFSACIITPVHFFILYALSNYLILHLFHIQELVSNIKMCIYQLSFSQTYKMAIKNSQK